MEQIVGIRNHKLKAGVNTMTINKEIDKKIDEVQPMYENIFKKEDGVYTIYKEKDNQVVEKKIARLIKISKTKVYIDDQTQKSYICFDNRYKFVEKEISRCEYLNAKNLLKYQKYGLDVMPDTSHAISKHLRNEEDIAKKEFTHNKLGFGVYGDELIYKLDKSTGINSLYSGELEIQPKGSIQGWIDMFTQHILGNSYLEFICMSSLSSIVLGYLGEQLSLDSMIVHIYGNSSTGKSTALKLAISMFGYPDVNKNGLYSNFNSTENALLRKVSGTIGVPFAFDEISMSNLSNPTKLIYKLANGKDKARLNKSLEQEKADIWNTVILTNGEKSLIKSSDKNAGVQVRVVEIGNVTWTKDAINSDTINRAILENYGYVGFEFAKYVMKIGKEKLVEIYNKTVIKLNKFFKNNSVYDEFTARRSNKFALIMVTLTLFKKMFKLSIDNNEILKILLEIEKESIKSRNFNKSALDYIKQYISSNGSKFVYFDRESDTKDYLGKLNKKGDYTELVITPIAFEKILKEGGFEDTNVVLKEFKKNGTLNCESDRFTRKRQLEKGITTNVYVINLKNED